MAPDTDADGGVDMEQYRRELDQIIAPVLPDDDPVHDRLPA